MKTLARILWALGGLLMVASVVLGVIGIWTVGDDSSRYGASAFVAFFAGFLTIGAGAFVEEAL